MRTNMYRVNYFRSFFCYKENDTFYYYQSAKSLTKNVYDIIDKGFFDGFFIYYNESKETCNLIKDKLSATVPIG